MTGVNWMISLFEEGINGIYHLKSLNGYTSGRGCFYMDWSYSLAKNHFYMCTRFIVDNHPLSLCHAYNKPIRINHI
jgi:hypothetical protein